MRPLCFIFEAKEETKTKLISDKKIDERFRNFYCRKSILCCCWDAHILLHQALLISFKCEDFLLNRTQMTGARHEFHFKSCMLFCIAWDRTGWPGQPLSSWPWAREPPGNPVHTERSSRSAPSHPAALRTLLETPSTPAQGLRLQEPRWLLSFTEEETIRIHKLFSNYF